VKQGPKEAKPPRLRGARLWRVLVVSGMALGVACAGGQRTGDGSGTGNAGQDSGGKGGSGSGAGGW
jgi:hypothetical protein